MGKIIEFKTPLGQRTLVNTDYIVLVSDTKSNNTRIFVAVQSKNSGVMPLDVIGSYDDVKKLIEE
jgi:hypothetical protein